MTAEEAKTIYFEAVDRANSIALILREAEEDRENRKTDWIRLMHAEGAET